MLGPLLAAALVFHPPLGPAAEAQGRALARPFDLGAEVAGGSRLWHLEVRPDAFRFGLGPSEEAITAWVVVRLEPGAPPRVVVQGEGAGGPAPRRLAETLRRNLEGAWAAARPAARGPSSGHARREAFGPGPPTRSAAAGGPARAPPHAALVAPEPAHPWELHVLWGALLVLAGLLAASRAALRGGTPSPPWPLLLAITASVAVVAALGPDVLAYQSSHGIAWAEAVAAPSLRESPDAFGFTALGLDRLLGGLAPAGAEAFWASRVAWVILVLVAYAAAATLSRRRDVGLAAAALLVTEPSLAFLGRAAFPTVPGLAWAALTLWLVGAAARRPAPRLILAGSVALAVLASFRAMGPVVAPLVAAWGAASLGAARGRRLSAAAWAALLAGAVAVGAVELVQGQRLLVAARASAVSAAPLSADGVLFLVPHWEPLGRGALGLLGLAWLGSRRRGLLGALAALGWVAIVVWLTRGSVDTWSNLPRYQAWALLPADYLGALGLVVAGRGLRRGWRRARWARVPLGLVATAAVVGWGAGEVYALRSASLEHPESAQLALWRGAIHALPERAELVLPREPLGPSSAVYPLAELRRRRPGVEVWRSDQLAQARAAGRPVYRFEPLFCHVAYRETAPPTDVDCVTLPKRGTWEPVVVRVVRGGLPKLLAAPGYDPSRWMLLPLTTPSAEIGLYRLVQ